MNHTNRLVPTIVLFVVACLGKWVRAQVAPVGGERPECQPVKTATLSSGEVTVRMVDGLDSASEHAGTISDATVTNSKGAAVPVETLAKIKLVADSQTGGFSAQLVQFTPCGTLIRTGSSHAVLGGGWSDKMNNKLRAPGAPRDALSGARVFLPEGTLVQFTLVAPAEEQPGPIAQTRPQEFEQGMLQASTVSAAPTRSGQAVDFTVSEIGIGMTLTQVKEKLGSAVRYQLVHYQDPSTDLLEAYKGKLPATPSDTRQTFAIILLEGRVVYIHRFITFGSQEEPNFRTTAQQLLDKFGPPTKLFGTVKLSGDYIWEYDRENLILSPSQFGAINIDCPFQGQQNSPPIPGVGEAVGPVAARWTKNCHRQAESTVMPDPNNIQLVRTMDLEIEDQVPLYEHDSGIEQQQQDKLKQAAKDAEKRKAPM